ncbi:cytochrome P450 [Diaphorobacter ruginosibacter]|uniref:cytochrome P450 n=1 Tax=Diaphorobacter ruginosibacter TaxID=1715720 RepID=UPI00333E290F
MSHQDISSRFCHYIYDLARDRPGRNEICRQHGFQRVLVIQNLEDADRIMRRNVDNYPKNSRWISQVAGNSRLTEEGGQWKFRQNLSQPFFSKYDASRAFSVSMTHGRHMAEHLLREPDAQVLDEALVHQGMLSIFTQMFLEVELSHLPMAHDSASRLIELASSYAFVPPGQESLKDSKERIREILQLRKTIFNALQCLRGDAFAHSPMLNAMLEAESAPGFDFTFEKELTTLFDAGSDTASYSIGWALHLLAENPDLQEHLHAAMREVHALHGHDPQALESAIAQHADLRCFISELLRLYPPLPFITRLARDADQLSDMNVEPGDVVVVSLVGVNHKALGRADPWKPDLRAARREGFGMGTGTISGFVWGRRVCGGRSFALVELAAVLGVLILRLKVEVSRQEPVVYEWVGQMRRKGGHLLKFMPRP